jgi:hypothetical protein
MPTTTYTDPTLDQFIPGFRISLRARNRSPKTIKAYSASAEMLHQYLSERGMPTEPSRALLKACDGRSFDQRRTRPSSGCS